MKSNLKGQLIKWNDNRGFGFIKPSEGGREVFLHITSVKTTGRRPQVGDTIFYQLTAEADGKIRASNALIQGVVSPASATQKVKTIPGQSKPVPQKTQRKKRLLETLFSIGGVIIFMLLVMQFSPSRSPDPVTAITQPDCLIKGNVSINTGRRLYHLPGMEDYESTVINKEYGERWFCSEAEAVQAGWVKAPR